MVEEKQEQVGESQAVVEDSQEINYAEELKKLKEAQAVYEQRFEEQKELIKKRDSTISKLSKEKEQAEMEKLSEAERAEAEKQKAIEEANQIKAETEQLRRDRDLSKVLYSKDLDPELFKGRIVGNTEEEMAADADALNASIDKAVEARLEKEITSRLGGKKPEGGREVPMTEAERVERARKLSQGRQYY